MLPVIKCESNENQYSGNCPHWCYLNDFSILKALPDETSMFLVLYLVTQSCPTLCDPMYCSLPSSSVHGDSPGKNTGVDCHALLQGIFSTQGYNPGLLCCGWILYHLSHQGSPRILEWVACPPRDLPGAGAELAYSAWQADSLPVELPGKSWDKYRWW